MLRRSLPALALTATLGLAACGGEGGGSGGGGDGVTQQQFAQQANEICRQLDQRAQQAAQQLRQPESVDQIVGALGSLVQDARQGADRIGALPRPEGPEGDLARRFAEAADREVEQELQPRIDDIREAVRDQNPRAIRRAFERLGEDRQTEANRLAQQLGATECAS